MRPPVWLAALMVSIPLVLGWIAYLCWMGGL